MGLPVLGICQQNRAFGILIYTEMNSKFVQNFEKIWTRNTLFILLVVTAFEIKMISDTHNITK